MFALYNTTTGELASVGSVVVSPVPADLSVLDLGSDDRLSTGYGRWSPALRAIVDVVPSPGEALANQTNIEAKALTALTVNAAFLAVPAPTNAQVLTQVKVLTREVSGLIRLLLGQLDSTEGT